MNLPDLELCKKERVDDLNEILEIYRNTRVPRKSISIIIFMLVICGIALYFTFSFIIGDPWAYIITATIIMIGVYCYSNLDIKIKNVPLSIGNLAYRACMTMEALIKIKEGSYCPEFNIVHVGDGKHPSLYKKFVLLYPELANKDLKKLSRIEVTRKDINDIFSVHE